PVSRCLSPYATSPSSPHTSPSRSLPLLTHSTSLSAPLSFPTRRSSDLAGIQSGEIDMVSALDPEAALQLKGYKDVELEKYPGIRDRKSTRLNSSHVSISYAGFCWKKKKIQRRQRGGRRFQARGTKMSSR